MKKFIIRPKASHLCEIIRPGGIRCRLPVEKGHTDCRRCRADIAEVEKEIEKRKELMAYTALHLRRLTLDIANEVMAKNEAPARCMNLQSGSRCGRPVEKKGERYCLDCQYSRNKISKLDVIF